MSDQMVKENALYVKGINLKIIGIERSVLKIKGHDGLCPTPNPHLIERQHCAYCHLIERVKEHYKSKGKSEHKTYDDGYQEGWSGAIKALQQMDGLHQ